MNKTYVGWHQSNARQLSAHADQHRHKKFNLMPIQVSTNTNIVERYGNISAVNIFQRNSFVYDRTISCKPAQGFTQHFRGGGYVIEESELAKIRCQSKVKSEKIVLQCVGYKIQKSYLISNSEARR